MSDATVHLPVLFDEVLEQLQPAPGGIFVDGTLNSRTAAMLTDYRDAAPGFPRGQALMGVGSGIVS